MTEGDRWQPIETAPDEGEFLAYVPMWERVFQVRLWDAARDRITVCEPTKGRLFPATHWMPLPDAPARALGQERA